MPFKDSVGHLSPNAPSALSALRFGFLLAVLALPPGAVAQVPDCPEDSFASSVLGYEPGSPAPKGQYQNAEAALGTNDCGTGSGGVCYVSLGRGGTIELEFSGPPLTASGDAAVDLWVFEIGPDIESVFVEVSADGEEWTNVGKIGGGTRGVDIDGKVDPGSKFSRVRLKDDPNQGNSGGDTVGADIDAVCLLSTGLIATEVPPGNRPSPKSKFAASYYGWAKQGEMIYTKDALPCVLLTIFDENEEFIAMAHMNQTTDVRGTIEKMLAKFPGEGSPEFKAVLAGGRSGDPFSACLRKDILAAVAERAVDTNQPGITWVDDKGCVTKDQWRAGKDSQAWAMFVDGKFEYWDRGQAEAAELEAKIDRKSSNIETADSVKDRCMERIKPGRKPGCPGPFEDL